VHVHNLVLSLALPASPDLVMSYLAVHTVEAVGLLALGALFRLVDHVVAYLAYELLDHCRDLRRGILRYGNLIGGWFNHYCFLINKSYD
jgi:hypothetical protein